MNKNEFSEFGLRVCRACLDVLESKQSALAQVGLGASPPEVHFRGNIPHSEVEITLYRNGQIEDVLEHFIFDNRGNALPLATIREGIARELDEVLEELKESDTSA